MNVILSIDNYEKINHLSPYLINLNKCSKLCENMTKTSNSMDLELTKVPIQKDKANKLIDTINEINNDCKKLNCSCESKYFNREGNKLSYISVTIIYDNHKAERLKLFGLKNKR